MAGSLGCWKVAFGRAPCQRSSTRIGPAFQLGSGRDLNQMTKDLAGCERLPMRWPAWTPRNWNRALVAMADALDLAAPRLQEANARDLQVGRDLGLSGCAGSTDPDPPIESGDGRGGSWGSFPSDPVGRVLDERTRPNPLRKVQRSDQGCGDHFTSRVPTSRRTPEACAQNRQRHDPAGARRH